MIEVLDTYYNQVVNQMAVVSPTQAFGGYIDAQDWPQTPLVDSSLILVFLSAVPVSRNPEEAEILYQYQCQWVWTVMGTDIQAGQVGSNRGDRFRTNFIIIQNLRQANYPSFCAKKSYSVNETTGVVTGTSFTSPSIGGADSIWWSKLRFMPKSINQSSGLVYGAAKVDLYSYDSVLSTIQ